MKMLSRLWKAFKGEDAKASSWIVHQAQWDAKRKLYIVGDIKPTTEITDPNNPIYRTVDSGDVPAGWHQCFYYYEEPTNQITGGTPYRRCRNLAGPGYKPTFCILHAEQEAALHTKTEAEKKQQTLVDMPQTYRYVYCRYGPCVTRVLDTDEYCTEHAYCKNIADNNKPVQKTTMRDWTEVDDCGCYGYCDKHFNNGQARTQEQIEWDAIQEDIDWVYCNRIGYTDLKFRQNRKGIPLQAQETVHFKLELRGSRDEIDLFHAILALCDSDYPLDPFRKNTKHPEECKNCNGYIWSNAIITAPDIKKAARQAGITVKVRFYFPEATCKKKDRSAGATA